MRLSLSLLGGVTITRGGLEITKARYGKVLGLLAYLSTEASVSHHRDTLREMFWPDMEPEAGRQNLRQKLLLIRKMIGNEFLITDRESVRVRPESVHVVDVGDFLSEKKRHHCAPHQPCPFCLTEWTTRLALYKGEFLAGFTLGESIEFEEWLEVKREQLRLHAITLAERLVHGHRLAGNIADALAFAKRHVQIDVLSENAHRRVMELFFAQGNRSAAIEQYQIFCRVLREELSAVPGESLQKFYRSIIDANDAPAPASIPSQPEATLLTERRAVAVLHLTISIPNVADCDELAGALAEPHGQCERLICKNGGFVFNEHLGSIVAYFGFPRAMEGAAQKAARTALELRDYLLRLHPLVCRLAIHAGTIITGGKSFGPDLSGVTTKHCRGLSGHAFPGEICASDEIHPLLRKWFHLEQRAEGPGWRLLDKAHIHNGIEAKESPSLFVGREKELANLSDALREAAYGRTFGWLIEGDPGVGKSRLVHELRRTSTVSRWFTIRCQPEHKNTPFYVLREFFSSVDDLKLWSAETSLHGDDYSSESFCIRSLLQESASVEATPTVMSNAEQYRKRLTKELVSLSWKLAEKPAVLVIEDLQWADHSTLEWLETLVRQFPREVPLVVIGTARSIPDNLRDEQLGIRRLLLDRLPDAAAAQIIENLAGPLEPVMIETFLRLTDGIPLFIEEVVAHHLIDTARRSLPLTLHDLLSSRLDDLGPHRAFIQTAALFGREFDTDDVTAIMEIDEGQKQIAIHRSLCAGLIMPLRAGYQFKHALLQQAAYESLPKSRRTALHCRAAALLKTKKVPPEIVANHHALGGEPGLAIEQWRVAARLAKEVFANVEAVAHCTSALEQIRLIPEEEARDLLELEFQETMVMPIGHIHGYGSDLVSQAYMRIHSLRDKRHIPNGDWSAAFTALLVESAKGNVCATVRMSQDFHSRAAATGDRRLEVVALLASGNAQFWLGHFQESHDALGRLETLIAEEPSVRLELMDPRVVAPAYRALDSFFLGQDTRALSESNQALRVARELGQPNHLGLAYTFRALLLKEMGYVDEMEEIATLLIDHGLSHELALWRLRGEMIKGWCLAQKGESEGLRLLQRAHAGLQPIMPVTEPLILCYLIEASLALGERIQCAKYLREAARAVERTSVHYLDAEFLRLEALSTVPESAKEGRALLQRAIELARTQGSPVLEFRAAAHLSELNGDLRERSGMEKFDG